MVMMMILIYYKSGLTNPLNFALPTSKSFVHFTLSIAFSKPTKQKNSSSSNSYLLSHSNFITDIASLVSQPFLSPNCVFSIKYLDLFSSLFFQKSKHNFWCMCVKFSGHFPVSYKKWPDDFTKATIVTIYKKMKASECADQSFISLNWVSSFHSFLQWCYSSYLRTFLICKSFNLEGIAPLNLL